MIAVLLTWLIRYGHVLSGGVWVGGYALMVLVVVPLMAKGTHEVLNSLAIRAVRVLTYAGMLTIAFGIVLISRTRGVGNLLHGEWGGIVIMCLVIAIALLGLGDGALRPALRRLATTGDAKAARRYALLGFGLTILAVGLMTRALYASS